MAQRLRWFFYSGKVPTPVRLQDGRSFSVRPRGYVFTTDTLAGQANNLRVCAPPENAAEILASLGIASPDDLAPVLAPGPLSSAIAELGSASAGVAPPEPPVEVGKKGVGHTRPEAAK